MQVLLLELTTGRWVRLLCRTVTETAELESMEAQMEVWREIRDVIVLREDMNGSKVEEMTTKMNKGEETSESECVEMKTGLTVWLGFLSAFHLM